MIRQHLTTGVPSLTFHPWPWAESFSYRGQPSISSHQSHKCASPSHSPQPLLAPTSITTLYPFTDIWENTNTSTPLSLALVCGNTSTYSKHLWNMECVVLSGELQVYPGRCSLVTRLLRYLHLRWDMTWGWNPLAHRQLRPQTVVTDCGHEHPEDHLALKPLDQKSRTSHRSVIFRLSCAGRRQCSDIWNALSPLTASIFFLYILKEQKPHFSSHLYFYLSI